MSRYSVLYLVLKLDKKKLNGPDNVRNAFLIRYAVWACRYLTVIFKQSLSTASVPSSWRRAKILPLYKSGNKPMLTN